jgi:hypothetical protein
MALSIIQKEVSNIFPNRLGRPKINRDERLRRLEDIEPGKIELDRIYSAPEAAKVLDIHLHKVHKWLRSGELRGRNVSGSKGWIIVGKALLEFVDNNPPHP